MLQWLIMRSLFIFPNTHPYVDSLCLQLALHVQKSVFLPGFLLYNFVYQVRLFVCEFDHLQGVATCLPNTSNGSVFSCVRCLFLIPCKRAPLCPPPVSRFYNFLCNLCVSIFFWFVKQLLANLLAKCQQQ